MYERTRLNLIPLEEEPYAEWWSNPAILQLRREWEQPWYTDLVSVDAGMACPLTHPETFLFDKWPGMAHGCYCANKPPAKRFYYEKRCDEIKSSLDCYDLEAKPDVIMDVIKGVKFCAKTSKSYLSDTTLP